MDENIKTAPEYSAAVIDLCHLLKENLHKFWYGPSKVGFRQREEIIKQVLASDGGKETLDNSIKYIDSYIQKIKDAKTRSDAADKKHPFLHLFKPASEDKQYYRHHQPEILYFRGVREEISTIYRVANVIELSGLANKPKVG